MKDSTDLRVKRTRRWLQGALRDLMKTKPYSKIKIGEIAQKADVARPTFYLHYSSKDELLVSLFDDLFHDFREALENELAHQNVDLRLFGRLVFNYSRQNAEGFGILLDSGVDNLVEARFRTIILELSTSIRVVDPNRPESDELLPYIDDFIAAGMFAMLKRWLKEGMVIPDETMGLMLSNVAETLRDMVSD
jgi:AcrR family transcriptional regulator